MTDTPNPQLDSELRAFIESWIPINVKDSAHVKQAKIEARDEFMQLIKARDEARDAEIRIDTLEGSFMECNSCAMRTAFYEAKDRKYKEGACGYCGGTLYITFEALDDRITALTPSSKQKEESWPVLMSRQNYS